MHSVAETDLNARNTAMEFNLKVASAWLVVSSFLAYSNSREERSSESPVPNISLNMLNIGVLNIVLASRN